MAETWECSTHPDGVSTVCCGTFDKMELTAVIKAHPEYLGERHKGETTLPILVKLIDARKDLSVQVHPDDDYAKMKEHGQLGKTEMWYVLDAARDAKLIYGLRQDCTKKEMQKALAEGTVMKYLQKVPIHKDDLFFIPAGTIHAIGAGALVAEIQESSNLTYRLYDYDRMDPKTGKPRKMHVKEVYENVTIPDDQILPTRGRIVEQGALTHTVYYDAPGEYTAGRVQVKEKASFALDEFYFLFCVNGGGTVNGQRFQMGDVLFVPQKFGPIDLAGDMDFVYCSYKNKP